MDNNMTEIKEDIATIKANLQEHMRRTEASEKRHETSEARLTVVEQNMYRAQGAIIFIGLLSTLASLAMIFLK
jgi:hypothetical protein